QADPQPEPERPVHKGPARGLRGGGLHIPTTSSRRRGFGKAYLLLRRIPISFTVRAYSHRYLPSPKERSAMYRRILAVVGAVALAATGVLLMSGTAQAANLVANPGFETGSLSPWTCSGGSVVTTPVHTGTKAVQGNVSGSDFAQCSQNVTV